MYFIMFGFVAHSHIIYINYDHFMVEFLCFDAFMNACKHPEVRFWSRERSARPEDLRRGEYFLDKLCVDKNKFVNIKHKRSMYEK